MLLIHSALVLCTFLKLDNPHLHKIPIANLRPRCVAEAQASEKHQKTGGG